MAAIEISGLEKTYSVGFWRKRPKLALRPLTLSVEYGEIFGFLGPNGAGKTTTLKMLMGLVFPTSGTARILGMELDDPHMKAQIGFLPEHPYFYDYLTGRELLTYFGELAGMSPASIAGRIAELQVSFQLADFLDKRVGRMSTGMKQRLSLCRVVLHDPPVLIFDEPTSGLDVMGAREVLRIVLDLKSKGRTIIFSTHIMTEAERICDEIAIIERGSILAKGSVDSLRQSNGGGSLEDVFVSTVDKVFREEAARGEPVRP